MQTSIRVQVQKQQVSHYKCHITSVTLQVSHYKCHIAWAGNMWRKDRFGKSKGDHPMTLQSSLEVAYMYTLAAPSVWWKLNLNKINCNCMGDVMLFLHYTGSHKN